MFANYLKIVLRNIRKQKFYAFINLSGLTLGLFTSLLILLYILDEFSYDRFHEDAGLIYRVNLYGRMSGQEFNSCYSSAPVAGGFQEEIPEVEDGCRIAPWDNIAIIQNENTYTEKTVLLADSNFFDFFSFNLIQGDPQSVLSKPYSLVLTETAANKIFGYLGPGDRRAIGQILEFGVDKWACTVTGIIEDPPPNSHFHFGMILSMESWSYSQNPFWIDNRLLTYLKLYENIDWKEVDAKIPTLVRKHIGPQAEQFLGITWDEFQEQGNAYGFYLQPLLDIHFAPEVDLQLEPGGDMSTIHLLIAIAAFIVVIASINFMNLSTARFSGRAKEVGIRKSLGAAVRGLRIQFLIESVFYTLVSLLLAQLVLMILLPRFNELSGKIMCFISLFDPLVLSGTVLFVILIGILAGSYPAFYLTSFRPVEVLRGRIKAGMKSKGIRSILVVFQFTLSIGLIICTLLIYKQLQYLQEKDLGFNKTNVMVIRNIESLGSSKIAFKEELLKLPEVMNASISNQVPPEVAFSDLFRPRGEENQERGSNYCIADEDLEETLQLSMADGRFFSKEFPSDSSAVVINEAASQLFGWEDPVGQKLQTFWKENDADVREVIGVVHDYNYQSLEEGITSLILFLGTEGNNLMVRISPENVNRTIHLIRLKWESFAQGTSFDYSFIADDFNAKFLKEEKLGILVLLFTCLAIVIGAMGLFGLATFTSEQRFREIGIRKAMGASSDTIFRLISLEYMKLILVSFVVAIPLSYAIINGWLKNFAIQTNLGVIRFLTGGIIALIVALLSVSYQSLKAALRNPVDSLRYE